MKPFELERIRQTIEDQLKIGIETHVNGKIRKMDEKLDAYIKEDNEWKARANPTIELGNNIRGFGKVFAYLLGIGATVFGIIKYFFK
jgi:hypothetical protein